MGPKKEIATTDDVIKLAVEKSGMTEAQILSVYNFLVQQLKNKSTEPGIHAIYWGGLGTFYIRYKALIRKLKQAHKFYNTEYRSAMVEKLRNKEEDMRSMQDNWLYRQSKRISNLYLTTGLTREQMQEKQNEHYEKDR